METGKAAETAKKGKKGIVTLIFSRIFIFALMLFIQLVILAFFFWHVNEQYKVLYDILKILSIILTLYIVNEQADPTMKLIWAIFILIIPVFGTLMYLYVKFQLGSLLLKIRLDDINKKSDSYLEADSKVYDSLKDRDKGTASLAKYIYDICGCPANVNTKVTYYPSGEEQYKDIISKLESAREFIFLEYFIIERGAVWDSILEILKKKVKEGVEVRVMYDGMCSLIQLPMGYFKKLREYGIKAKPFSPMQPFLSTHQNNRDHRKILVVDGKTAFTGGINLADEYMNLKIRFGYWKDTGVMVEGDAAKSFTLMFLQMWNVDEKKIGDYDKYLNVEMPVIDEKCGYVMGYGDEPFDGDNVGEEVYLHMINTATDYVHIITPYLVIDDIMMRTLKIAAKRGVDVKLVMPGIPDKAYAYCLARTYYEELMEAGVKIYEYTPGFTHAKVFVVDGIKATVGSINLDYRSFYLHFECGLYMFENPVIDEIEMDFQDTLAQCHMVTKEECQKRNILYRLTGSILRIIAPLM